MLKKLIALALFCALALSATGCDETPKPILLEAESENQAQLTVSEADQTENQDDSAIATVPENPDSSKAQSAFPAETSKTEKSPDNSSPSLVASAPEKTKPPTVKPPSGNQTGTAENKPPAPTEPPKPKPDPEPTVPPVTSEPSEPESAEPPTESTTPPPDVEKEYERIICETIDYAESYAAKGFTFVWDDSLKFCPETGGMGTPRVKYEGVDGVIEILKHHIDMIVKTATDPGNGIPGYSANYKVMQVTVDGDIAFVVLYG